MFNTGTLLDANKLADAGITTVWASSYSEDGCGTMYIQIRVDAIPALIENQAHLQFTDVEPWKYVNPMDVPAEAVENVTRAVTREMIANEEACFLVENGDNLFYNVEEF